MTAIGRLKIDRRAFSHPGVERLEVHELTVRDLRLPEQD
jgi:hypothetical protein